MKSHSYRAADEHMAGVDALEELAQAISEAVADINEGQTFTMTEWRHVAAKVFAASAERCQRSFAAPSKAEGGK